MKEAIQTLNAPILIIHGANDEAIPVEHGEALYSWIKNSNKKAVFTTIPCATHTFNTKHPFEKSSDELDELIKATIEWIQTINCRD